MAVAENEEPYDVFICYKESDENGKRTVDSVLAQDIYYQLKNDGFKVFFARITLEDKLGTEYEPYIFSALNSAGVMLVIGTKQEYFEAVWVKNEWERFLALMKKDKNKRIIPCYRDIDPYEIPDKLSMFQSQDMSKIGFIQDLIRGIKKIASGANAQKKEIELTSEGRMVRNAETYLELNNYELAEKTYISITKDYPGDYRGWWGLIVCETKSFTKAAENPKDIETWFSYVQKLSGEGEYEALRKKYIEYLKIAAEAEAKNDIERVRKYISNLKDR